MSHQNHRSRRRRLIRSTVPLAMAAVALGGWAPAPPASAAPPAAAPTALASTPHYSLPLALQESWYFYDAEKSGPSRSLGQQPLQWRGDSEPSDATVPLKTMTASTPGAHSTDKNTSGGTNMSESFMSANKTALDPDGNGSMDLSGGFHDAGDHVKFGLPQSYTAATLGWGLTLFPEAFKATTTWEHGLEEMRWFTDYLLRATFLNSSGQVVAFAYQVGEGNIDHDYWGPPELQLESKYHRPAYFATSEKPASDQTSGAAAALAVESILVKDTDPAYAAKCLKTAQALYTFSVAHRGKGYTGGFYESAFDEDELSWAAAWLYVATGTHKYLEDIVSTDSSGKFTGWINKIIPHTGTTWQNIWVHSWDTKWGGVFSVIDPLVGKDSAIPDTVKSLIHYFNKWSIEYWSHVPHDNSGDSSGLAWSPGGFAVLTTWGSARYNAAAQLEALAYRKNFPSDPKGAKFTDWAMGQMNYIMGDNPLNRSFIVGFGSTTPGVGSLVGGKAVAASHPHHAAAHGSLTNDQDNPKDDRHILWGGLVGGPDAGDNHSDITTDFVLNEVAIDYNAALPGALAGLYQYYGQSQKMTSFTPPAEPAENGYYATGYVNQDTNQETQITVAIHNDSTLPPHLQTDMSARYYFDISSLHAQGQTIKDITTPIYYDAAKDFDSKTTTISKPVRWGEASSCVYYVTIDWTGNGISGARELEFGVHAEMGPNYKWYWSSAKSPSFAGLAAGTYKKTPSPNLPVYLGGKLVFGNEPSTTANTTCGS
jgi:hypothetical protein